MPASSQPSVQPEPVRRYKLPGGLLEVLSIEPRQTIVVAEARPRIGDVWRSPDSSLLSWPKNSLSPEPIGDPKGDLAKFEMRDVQPATAGGRGTTFSSSWTPSRVKPRPPYTRVLSCHFLVYSLGYSGREDPGSHYVPARLFDAPELTDVVAGKRGGERGCLPGVG